MSSPEGKGRRKPSINPAEAAIGRMQQGIKDLAKPTLPALKSLSREVSNLSHEQYQGLTTATYGYEAEAEPGSPVQTAATITRKMLREYGGNFYDADNIDGKAAGTDVADKNAETVMKSVVMDREEDRIGELSDSLKAETDPDTRKKIAKTLKRMIRSFSTKHDLKFGNPHEYKDQRSYSWEEIAGMEWSISTEFPNGKGSIGFDILQTSINTLVAVHERDKFDEKMGKISPIDQKRFDELRKQYGAKGANLVLLSEKMDSLNELWDYVVPRIMVPEFKLIPVDVYNAWRKGEDIDSTLQSYYEWTSEKRIDKETDRYNSSGVMIRSSAVYSEDGVETTGAGIYESTWLWEDHTFDEFKERVVSVFQSTNSERAKEYRRQHGIPDEEMGIVLQDYVARSYSSRSEQGQANSRVFGNPQLMEIDSGSRNLIRIAMLDHYIGARSYATENASLHEVFHFEPDSSQASETDILDVAKVLRVIERMWKKPVQIEFVIDKINRLNVVQVRGLPEDTMENTIEFPEEPSDFTGAGVGVGDMELDFLKTDEDNSEKKGVVMITSNNTWTLNPNYDMLPKEGAVILFNGHSANGGHIQTLCLEKGLVCVFPESRWDWLNTQDKLLRSTGVRVISNGIEGRIYSIGEKEEQEASNEIYSPGEVSNRRLREAFDFLSRYGSVDEH